MRNFKKAYDSVDRSQLIKALKEMKVPEWVIRLVRMTLTLTNTECKFRINGIISDKFKVQIRSSVKRSNAPNTF